VEFVDSLKVVSPEVLLVVVGAIGLLCLIFVEEPAYGFATMEEMELMEFFLSVESSSTGFLYHEERKLLKSSISRSSMNSISPW
jgi:hypothetical protein